MIKRILQILLLSLLPLLLAGCGDKPCVSADDWGYPKVYVPANGDDMNLQGQMSQQSVDGIGPNQVLIDAETVPLVITVDEDDKWTSWFGRPINNDSINENYGPWGQTTGWLGPEDLIPEYKECLYELVEQGSSGIMAPKYKKARTRDVVNGQFVPFSCPEDSATVPNPDKYADCWVPCWFKEGMGLYVGLAPRSMQSNGDMEGASSSSLNQEGVKLVDRVVVAKHIPDAKHPEVPKVYDPNTLAPNNVARGQDGYLIRGIPAQEIPGAMTGDALFFKIVDGFYEDNYGGYHVKIKSGTRDPKPGPLETVFHAFSEPIDALMKRIYKGVVNNTEYINMVRALLVLYILFFAYAYLMGMVEKPRTEFITKVVKFGIIAQLISPDSWDFFYNNFFAAFVDGVLQIAVLIATPFADYDPASPWYSMDQILKKFASAETAAKVGSTLFSNIAGFLLIIVFYISLALFIIAAIKALTVYIVAYIGIAFMVALAPLFIIFLLFDKTRELFEEWVNQLVAFSLQQIILFAGLGMFAALLFHFLTEAVGYRVCWETWFNFSLMGYHIVDLKYWFPNIRDLRADLWMDWGRGIVEFYTQYRPHATGVPSLLPFVDLPYFDPEKELLKINEYRNQHDFLKWGDIFVYAASVYFMFSFMSFVPIISSSLKSGSSGRHASADIYGSGFRLWDSGMTVASTAKDYTIGNVSIDYDQIASGKKFSTDIAKKGRMSAFGLKWDMGGAGKAVRGWNDFIKGERESFGVSTAKEMSRREADHKMAAGSKGNKGAKGGGARIEHASADAPTIDATQSGAMSKELYQTEYDVMGRAKKDWKKSSDLSRKYEARTSGSAAGTTGGKGAPTAARAAKGDTFGYENPMLAASRKRKAEEAERKKGLGSKGGSVERKTAADASGKGAPTSARAAKGDTFGYENPMLAGARKHKMEEAERKREAAKKSEAAGKGKYDARVLDDEKKERENKGTVERTLGVTGDSDRRDAEKQIQREREEFKAARGASDPDKKLGVDGERAEERKEVAQDREEYKVARDDDGQDKAKLEADAKRERDIQARKLELSQELHGLESRKNSLPPEDPERHRLEIEIARISHEMGNLK
jgi:type IV secretory pathway VirB6-like protein